MGSSAKIYNDQLVGRAHGLPLWAPEPPENSSEVLIGDVGYMLDGGFYRLFNVCKSSDDPINIDGVPETFRQLTFHGRLEQSRSNYLDPGPLCSRSVKSHVANVNAGAQAAATSAGYSFTCSRDQGALLMLKDPAQKKAVHPNMAFVEYIRQHHQSWHDFAKNIIGLDISREEIILVRGWVKTTQWGVAAFLDRGRQHSIYCNGQFGPIASAGFTFSVSEAASVSVEHRSGPVKRLPESQLLIEPSYPQVVPQDTQLPCDQCIFLSHYKIKYRFLRVLPLKIMAGAEPRDLTDREDNAGPSSGAGIHFENDMIVETDLEQNSTSQKIHDPLDDVLDYILQHSDAEVAITSDGDVHEICNGEEWPEDLAAYLQEHLPRIDILEGKTGILSLEEAVIRAHTVSHPTIAPAIAQADMNGPVYQPDASDDPQEGPSSGRPCVVHGGSTAMGVNYQKGRSISWPHLLLVDTKNEGGAVCSLAVSNDGVHVGTGSEDCMVRVWNVEARELRMLSGHEDTVWAVAFSPDGTKVASGSADSVAIVWSVESSETLLLYNGHTGAVWSLAYSPDGRSIASGSADHTVRIWDPLTGATHAILDGHPAVALTVYWSPDGKRLVSASDNVGRIWDPVTGDLKAVLQGHTGVIWCVAFSADSRRIITGAEDQTARIWSAETGAELVTLREHTGSVWSASFSPDGAEVISGSYDSTVAVCDSYSGERRHLFEEFPSVVNSVAYSPDGDYIAAGGADGSVVLWDASDGKHIARVVNHEDKVKGVRFSPDGDNIFSFSDDGSVRVWSLLDILRL